MKITTTHRIQSTGHRFTLRELKEFVDHCEGAGANSMTPVNIETYKGDQRDPGYSTLTAVIDHDGR